MKSLLFCLSILGFLFGCTNRKLESNFIKFDYDGHILVNATINDSISGLFILDTGADGLYLDSNFIALNKSIVSSADTAFMRGAGNKGLIPVVIITNSIKAKIGNKSAIFDTIPILKLRQIVNADVAGIIGCDILKDGILAINNADTTLSLDTTIDVSIYNASIPFDYVDGRIFVTPKIEVNKNHSVSPKLMIDLGCADAIIFNSEYYKGISKLIEKHIDFSMADAGISGDSEGGEFRIASFTLGRKTKSEVLVSFSKDSLGAHSSTDYDGLLGNEMLSKYDYIIDFRTKKIHITENIYFSKPFNSTKTGVFAIKDTNFAIVKCVYHQFDAYQKGLRLGDSIVQINNTLISEISQFEIDGILEQSTKSIILKFASKNEIKEIVINPQSKI
jgi:hypothetical protein